MGKIPFWTENRVICLATKIKIVTHVIGYPKLSTVEEFDAPWLAKASQIHGDAWNDNFTWTDRFRSTMDILDEHSRRWKMAEVIN